MTLILGAHIDGGLVTPLLEGWFGQQPLKRVARKKASHVSGKFKS